MMEGADIFGRAFRQQDSVRLSWEHSGEIVERRSACQRVDANIAAGTGVRPLVEKRPGLRSRRYAVGGHDRILEIEDQGVGPGLPCPIELAHAVGRDEE